MAEKQQREGPPENGGTVNGTSEESDDSSPTRRTPRRRQKRRHIRSSDRRRPTDDVVPDEVARDPPRPVDRPQGRRRHYAGAPNRQPPDHDQAALLAGLQPEDNFPMPVAQEEEGPPSNRDLSPGSSFAAFSSDPPDDPPEREPFGGLPPMDSEQAASGSGGARPKTKNARRVRKGSRSTAGPSTDQDDDCYMDSASDSDETARPDAIGVADRRNRDNNPVPVNNNPVPVNNNPAPLPEPEPMCLSSDPE